MRVPENLAPDFVRGGSRISEQTTRKIEDTAMNIQTPRPAGHQTWEQVRTRLDQNAPFSNMYDTPYYRDAVYDHFSKAGIRAPLRGRCATRCASTSSTA